MNIKNSRIFHALVNKRFAIICLLIFCIGTLWATGILGQIVDGIEYTARGLVKAFKYMNEAASAYYNIQQIVDDLQEEFDELEADWKVAKGKFTQMWNIFTSTKVLYEAAVEDMWAANSDYNAAENQRIIAIGDINTAQDRIDYCNSMLDAAYKRTDANASAMIEYWKGQLAEARSNLSDAKSRKSQAIKDKADANKRYKSARRLMTHHKFYRDKWERDVEFLRRERDAAKDKMDAKADELDVKMGEEVAAGIENDKADAEYRAYKAGYNKQKSAGGNN